MSPIWIDKSIFSWSERANEAVDNKIKRVNFPVLHPTLISEKQLKPDTCYVLRIQGQVEQSCNSPAYASLESCIADGSVCACVCFK